MDSFVVIMAGGVGARFWPLSREKKPKQFISVDGGKCMLIQTIERVCQIIPPKNCFIITSRELSQITKDTVKDILPSSNIIEEPLRKNTATCIAYATLLLKQKFNTGLISFLPADGYVKDSDNYAKALKTGYIAAEKTKNIVTIGIKPMYPATGYGYIQADITEDKEEYFKVKRFIEKPKLEEAQRLVTLKEYFWNSGIVVGDMDVLIAHIKLFLPDHYKRLSEAILNADASDLSLEIEKAYEVVENISFDVAVLEKSEKIYTVKGIFDWDDMGSMEALSKTLDKDEKGNFVQGDFVGIETSDCVIYSDGMLITAIGMKDMVITSTKDAIVICPRDRVQEIKSLVNELKVNGYEDFI